jgi:hypothetical protein
MVTQLFNSSVAHQPNHSATEGGVTLVALPSTLGALSDFGMTLPALPKKMPAPVHIHKYRGRFRETFSVEGSPYGDQWLSQTTASVEIEAVKLLNIFRILNPIAMIFLLSSLLPLLLFWAVLQLASLPYDAIFTFFSGN